MSERTPKCRGLLGLVFGHKFQHGTWMDDRITVTNYCTRCGFVSEGDL